MKYTKLMLRDFYDKVGDSSFIEVYQINENPELNLAPYPVMIVVPGGGYEYCSARESEPVALRFVSEGFVCVTLTYSTKVAYPLPHIELACVMDFLYKHAYELAIDTNKICMVGFSAGGHLVSSFPLAYREIAGFLEFNESILLPFANILSYPVSSLTNETHQGSKDVITGGDKELAKKLSVSENVSENYPPTFIWTTQIDSCVPISNSTKLFEALQNKNVPSKLIIYENGDHGGSLFNRAVFNKDYDFNSVCKNKDWVNQAIEFIFSL